MCAFSIMNYLCPSDAEVKFYINTCIFLLIREAFTLKVGFQTELMMIEGIFPGGEGGKIPRNFNYVKIQVPTFHNP